MLSFGHLDESTHFHDQQKEKAGPVTIINTFVAPRARRMRWWPPGPATRST